MKKIVIFSCVLFLICSCNRQNKENSTTSDSDFDVFARAFPAKQIAGDKIIKYKVASEYSRIPELATEPSVSCNNIPTAISQLNSGSGYEVYKFTSDQSAGATAMGFSGSIGKKEILIIRDFVRYQFIDCGETKKKYGIGLRIFIHVKSIKAKLTGSFANIAASAQLDQGSAVYSLKSLGFGMEGDMLADELDGQGDYNVDNFGKIAITFNNVLKTLKNNNSQLIISPVELPN